MQARTKKTMLILIDLDGTLTNTVHPSWKPYKDGLQELGNIPVPSIPGAEEFIQKRTSKGDKILIVSDSHANYVRPLAQRFGLDCVWLADKPNTSKLEKFISSNEEYANYIETGDCVVIGDTKLDVEMGRKLKVKTIAMIPYALPRDWEDTRDGIGDKMLIRKFGPTYFAKNFDEVDAILDNPLEHLYILESAFQGAISSAVIRYSEIFRADHRYYAIRCLARQQSGSCDSFACADKYYQIADVNRTQEFIQLLADGLSRYINSAEVQSEHWDLFTYVSDKATTVPADKLKAIFDCVDTTVEKKGVFFWNENIQGSLRQRKTYEERRAFIDGNLQFDVNDVRGKNIIILDDQVTTGATAYYICRALQDAGANNILFVALFQMTMNVRDNMICPKCGAPMVIKIKRSTGQRFYSCLSPDYGGEGCGKIINID